MKGNYSRADIEAFRPEVVVIGAGLVGIAIVRQLAKASVKVLLLPGGSESSDLNSTNLATGSSIDLSQHEPLEENRPRIIGGNSKLWGGRIAALDQDDFLSRPWLGLQSWPISKSEIDSYIDSAADNFDAKISSFTGESGVEIEAAPGFDTPEIFSNSFETWVMHRDLYGFRAKEIQNSKHILLAENYHAVSLEVEDQTEYLKSVKIGKISQEPFQIASQFAIIAAGAIENSRLLLILRNQYKNKLPNLSSHIGEKYTTHTLTRIPSIVRPDALKVDSVSIGSLQVKRAIRLNYSLKEKMGIGNAIVTFTPPDLKLSSTRSIRHHSVRVIQKYGLQLPSKIWNYRSTISQSLRMGLNSSNNIKSQNNYPFMLLWGEHLPNSQSRIVLGEKMDSFGQPLAEAFIKFSELDKLTLLETAKFINNRIDILRLSPASIDWHQVSASIDEDLEYPNSHGHQIGGTIMGDPINGGVTNNFGEVHGVRGLYCGGSSLFPTSGYAAPTLTAMALGIRTADQIITKLGKSKSVFSDSQK